jgi:hypothetical protein
LADREQNASVAGATGYAHPKKVRHNPSIFLPEILQFLLGLHRPCIPATHSKVNDSAARGKSTNTPMWRPFEALVVLKLWQLQEVQKHRRFWPILLARQQQNRPL